MMMASRSCPNCGTIVPVTSQFCRNCGVPFATGMSGGEATPPQPPSSNPQPPYGNPPPGYGNPQPPYGNPQPGYGGMLPSSLPSVPAYGGPPAFNANAPWQTPN